MSKAQTLFKKEWLEFSRNYKLLIIGTLFLFFGFLNPLTAKFMPEVLSSVLPKNIAKSFPEPTAFDSWLQFFKNISQLGLFVFVLVFGSTLSNERQSGTLVLSLTKGLPRATVIIVKYVFAAVVWTVSYALCFGITYMYTAYYWPKDDVQQLFLAVFILWVFGLLLISLILLGNVLFRNLVGTLLFIAGFLILFLILAIFPKLEKIQLLRLATDNNAILHGKFHWPDYSVLLSTSGVLTIICLVIAVLLFNRKQL